MNKGIITARSMEDSIASKIITDEITYIMRKIDFETSLTPLEITNLNDIPINLIIQNVKIKPDYISIGNVFYQSGLIEKIPPKEKEKHTKDLIRHFLKALVALKLSKFCPRFFTKEELEEMLLDLDIIMNIEKAINEIDLIFGIRESSVDELKNFLLKAQEKREKGV
jgi:hypothetical protein